MVLYPSGPDPWSVYLVGMQVPPAVLAVGILCCFNRKRATADAQQTGRHDPLELSVVESGRLETVGSIESMSLDCSL